MFVYLKYPNLKSAFQLRNGVIVQLLDNGSNFCEFDSLQPFQSTYLLTSTVIQYMLEDKFIREPRRILFSLNLPLILSLVL